MKMAIVVINGLFTNHNIIASACAIAKASSSILHAFFLTPDTKSPEFDYLFPNDLSLTQNKFTGKTIDEENRDLVNANIELFIDSCIEKGVKYVIEPESGLTLKQLITHSAFADFIMADARANLDQYSLSDLLSDAHCPVFLISAQVEAIHKVIFMYDGGYSSIYAIKTYSYIFPEWKDVNTSLLYVASGEKNKFPFEKQIKGLVSQRYDNVAINMVTGNIQAKVIEFINSNSENSLVVMGAYGRSNLSRIIHKSFADNVIAKTKASVFIVHE